MGLKVDSKLSRELTAARCLRQRYRGLTGFRFYPQSPPEPDVRAVRRRRRIGIEVTEVHGNPKLRMTEAEQDRVLATAQAFWVDRGHPAVGVVVEWRATRAPTRYPKSLAPALVELVAANIPNSRSRTIFESELDTHLGAGGAIETIQVDSRVQATEWGAIRSWEDSPAGAKFIQREIDRKNSKRAQYRDAYSEAWLLLVHSPRPAAGFAIDASVLRKRYESTFDRVFLLCMAPFSAHRLAVRRLRSIGTAI